jgi:putative RecB family exonuclease
MATTYSFSRIGSFESCRLQYKYNYIDRMDTGVETIEAFMGSRVHEALKVFYDFVKNGVVRPTDWLLATYREYWQKNFHDGIKIVKNGYAAQDYEKKGTRCLEDYYQAYRPFSQAKVVKTEEPISFCIRDGGREYSFRGVLDRLDWNDRDKVFEIHDYKTSSSLLTQEDADRDWQLPIYQLALQSQWPEAKQARLVWHYLLFNKEIRSLRSQEQLEELQKMIADRIREIEACREFPPNKSALCEWCRFQEICPLWKHPKAMEKRDVNGYRQDPGVILVSKYAGLELEKRALTEKIRVIEEEQAKIEQAALNFAERENIRVIDGADHQLLVTVKDELAAPTRKEAPEKWEKLRDLLTRENRFIEVSTINNQMLNARIRNWPKEMVDKIRDFLEKRTVKKVELKDKK